MKTKRFKTLLILFLICCSTFAKPSPEVLENMKALILLKLGLKEAPADNQNTNINPEAKENSMRSYRRNVAVKNVNYENAMSVVQAYSANTSGIIFPFNEDELFHQDYSIKSALLNLIPKTELIDANGNNNITISIYRRKKLRYSISLSALSIIKNKTIQINILDDILDWKRKHGSRAKYKIKIRCNARKCIEMYCKPFINVEYQKRVRKWDSSANNKKCKDNECCRQSINISIEDLGWKNWFINPSVIKYSYCSGKCQNNTIYDRILKSLGSSAPCCAPTELTGFRAVYISGGLIYDEYLYNIMPAGCGCGGRIGEGLFQ